MRNVFAKVLYFTLVSPLLPVVALSWMCEKVENSSTLGVWESWAHKLTKKVTGV